MCLITVLSWFNRRGQFISHVGPGRFGQTFSLNKWNHHLKTAFCIYLHYHCVIFKLFVSWSESFKCDKYANKKKKKIRKGARTSSQNGCHTRVSTCHGCGSRVSSCHGCRSRVSCCHGCRSRVSSQDSHQPRVSSQDCRQPRVSSQDGPQSRAT